jgi:hypothetical protein
MEAGAIHFAFGHASALETRESLLPPFDGAKGSQQSIQGYRWTDRIFAGLVLLFLAEFDPALGIVGSPPIRAALHEGTLRFHITAQKALNFRG